MANAVRCPSRSPSLRVTSRALSNGSLSNRQHASNRQVSSRQASSRPLPVKQAAVVRQPARAIAARGLAAAQVLTRTAVLGPLGPNAPRDASFTRKRVQHALELAGSCIMLLGFLVLALFG